MGQEQDVEEERLERWAAMLTNEDIQYHIDMDGVHLGEDAYEALVEEYDKRKANGESLR